MQRFALSLITTLLILAMMPKPAATQPTAVAPVSPLPNACSRPAAGSVVADPPSLFSANGILAVRLSYQHVFDSAHRELFCFMTPGGLQNPTLHLNPGDRLQITVTNNLPPGTGSMGVSGPNCGAPTMNSSSLNIHYHGANVSPACHQDNVIKTTINPGQTFQYNVAFPANEPPGLYWYHPHIHGIAEHALLGGASGAIIVEGIEDVQPAVSELRQRLLIVRDQNVPSNPPPQGNVPSWDLSLNFIPITSPTDPNSNAFIPATLEMGSEDREFLRVANSSADTILDLQYVFDGVPQVMRVVAMDGVAVNSQDGAQPGSTIPVTHFVLAPAGRVEFIVSPPSRKVKLAQLVTLGIDTGPLGDNDPQRPLANIRLTSGESEALRTVPAVHPLNASARRFAGLAAAPIAVSRVVYFDENCPPIPDPINPCTPNQFYMGVAGKPEHLFDPNLPPDIVARQGTVEQWVIQNRAGENHEFHFHQVHFLVQSQDNFELNGSVQSPGLTGQYLDMIQVPYWDGNANHPYPSATVLIDFRGNDIGDFVFHCHILNHEDLGMMNIIQVTGPATAINNKAPAAAGSAALSAEMAPKALEIADRVVEPLAGKGQHH